MSRSSAGPGYRRVHVLPGPVPLRDAASFLTSALLVSNSIRRDTLAVVEVGRGVWVYAAGDRVRHLRPDADTAAGWLRAVLRGKRGLGGLALEAPPSPPPGFSLVAAMPGRGRCTLPSRAAGFYVVYGPVEAAARVYTGGLPAWLAPAVVNVILDRLASGLEPAPCCEHVNIPDFEPRGV